MKTAISLPDETFERATQRARDMGLSRSEFFARAADHYLDELDALSTRAQIDDALTRLEPDGSSSDAVAVGRSRLLRSGDDEW